MIPIMTSTAAISLWEKQFSKLVGFLTFLVLTKVLSWNWFEFYGKNPSVGFYWFYAEWYSKECSWKMKILAETCHFYDPFCPQLYSIAAPLSLGFPKKNWCNARFLICNVHFPVSILSFRSRKHLWTIFCQYILSNKKNFSSDLLIFLKKENNQSHKFIKQKIGLWQYAGGAG